MSYVLRRKNGLILLMLGATLSLILIVGLGMACLFGKLREEWLPKLFQNAIAPKAPVMVSQKEENRFIDPLEGLYMSGLTAQTIGGRLKAVFTGNSYNQDALEKFIRLGIAATEGNLTGQELRDIQDKPGDSPLEKKAKALIRAAHEQHQKWLAANDDANRWHRTADEREAERQKEELKRQAEEKRAKEWEDRAVEDRKRADEAKLREDRAIAREERAVKREEEWVKRADAERTARETAEKEARDDRKRADDVIAKIDRVLERLPAPPPPPRNAFEGTGRRVGDDRARVRMFG